MDGQWHGHPATVLLLCVAAALPGPPRGRCAVVVSGDPVLEAHLEAARLALAGVEEGDRLLAPEPYVEAVLRHFHRSPYRSSPLWFFYWRGL
jgi:hypothetical protein